MSLEQVKQFITLIEASGHCSTYSPNYVRLADGRISFIDTDGTFSRKKSILGIIRLLNEDIESYYSPEAGAYILNKLGYHYVRLSKQNQIYYRERIEEFLEDQPHIKKRLMKSIQYHKTIKENS